MLLGIWELIGIIILKKLKLIEHILDFVAFDTMEVGWSNAYQNSNGFLLEIIINEIIQNRNGAIHIRRHHSKSNHCFNNFESVKLGEIQ